jgi:rhodanese-related sulfurtransferase
MTPAAALIGVLAILGGAACSTLHKGEGRVLVARGSPVLLEDGRSTVLVALAPAASLTGIDHLRDLRPGDRVRYRWRHVLAGVRMAEELAADPVVGNDPIYTFREDELYVAYQQHREPVLVDARPEAEFRRGHLEGARSLPAGAGAAQVAVTILPDNGSPIVVYGASARDDSAHRVARALIAGGAKEVKVLQGGLEGWLEADHVLELQASDASAAMEGPTPWVVIDTRPRDSSKAGLPSGAVSVPPEAFRWEDFDGALPLPPLLFVGVDALDRSPLELADRVRMLRSARSVKTVVRLHVLAGGFEAWRRAGLPTERGGALRSAIPYQPISPAEISPEEFDALWKAQGGHGATFLDVRRVGTSAEPWVVKIPLEDLPARVGELPKDREIVAYCAVGERSRVAVELLKANGFRARFLRAQPGR